MLLSSIRYMIKGVIFTANTLFDNNRLKTGAFAVIQYLRSRGIAIGIVSFHDTEKQKELFSRSGIDSVVSFRIFNQFPNLAFEQAFTRLALSPSEVIIVTGKDENVLRANKLNCISVKIDPSGPYTPTAQDGDTPFYHIRTFEELIPLIT